MHTIARYRKAHIRRLLLSLLLALVPAFGSQIAGAKAPDGGPSKPPKLFASDAPLTLTLSAPWRELVHDKSAKKRYPGTLEYVDEAGAKRSIPVAFEARGMNRLKVCKFPPIKLIFDKEAAEKTPFRGDKALKLSTHCDNGERWEQYVGKEMLAYRIYNLVTERSFKVRAVSATYVDGADRDGPHVGFLVESDSAMAKRNQLEKLDIVKPRLEQLDSLQNSRFALFEFLIGNTDFAQLAGATADRCCHNSQLIGDHPPATVLAVPYDFDSSGLVDAHYAVPSPVLKIHSNRERVFRGFCANNATLESARAELVKLEPNVLELARGDTHLDARSKAWAADYLSKGFELLRDDAKFASEVTAKCRK